MMKEESFPEEKASYMLRQLEHILESDPLIDEVGFIHPSQFNLLKEEAASSFTSSDSVPQLADEIVSSERSEVAALNNDNTNFWIRDHKLGISTQLLFPLYKAAKHAFMTAIRQYKTISNLPDKSGDNNITQQYTLESEVMKHSRALLLLSCDFGTAWNFRKLVASKKQDLSIFFDELLLSALVLSYSPKSEQAWSHRRWVIKMIAGKCSSLQEIVGKESDLVEKISERSKMNYRAWNHRGWLVSYMKREQVLLELKKSRKWAGLHVADNCCFHYRRRLMLRILEDSCLKQENESSGCRVEIYELWKEELDWDEMLIKRYVGREALWLHRRFLSLHWMKHFAVAADLYSLSCHSKHEASLNDEVDIFIDNELCLLHSCSTIPDNEFEDFQAQAMYAVTYILWLTKQIFKSLGIDIREKLKARDLKTLLNEVFPERSFLWDLVNHMEASTIL